MYYQKFLIFILIFLFYFYRLPSQKIMKSYDKVYSPGYGRILDIKKTKSKIYLAIFLTPFDVHYQMIPISGIIKEIKYDSTGKYNLAYNLNKSKDNEKIIYKLTNTRGDFFIYQIAGFLVRRITSFVKEEDKVNVGEKLGIIHFGSRVDLILPSNNFKLMVKKGDYLYGSHSLIGQYN